ncbi:asparagine synthase (glutamine-hydrolyzing), partial [Planktomarina temperata]|nr:asparagine synthase (glutamine-hydrolyzing) [Planktomarina temperata]
MCGISGFLTFQSSLTASSTKQILKDMANALNHRGPDSSGIWFDEDAGIGLAHTRLSILDLTIAGHQPMSSHCGRYIINFNGEIYNTDELKEVLDQNNFSSTDLKSSTDTEVLIQCIAILGLDHTLKKALGMFAFALWDTQESVLSIARDRMGEKPLYYGWQGDGHERTFLFGSEIGALKKHPVFKPEIDREALKDFLKFNYVPAPNSIYKNIKKLSPGKILRISPKSSKNLFKAQQYSDYWSFPETANQLKQHDISYDPQISVNKLEKLITNAISRQMVADVPIGAFLSGGVDSSLVVAIMQKLSPNPIKTFSIGFTEKNYNEANYAKEVAQYLNTDHTEIYLTAKDAKEIVPVIAKLYDEPFADVSQIPTYLVSRLAKEHVCVSLSGDGGDELFGGYNRYTTVSHLWNKIRSVPLPIRRTISRIIVLLKPEYWTSILGFFRLNFGYSNIGDKIYKGAKVLDSDTIKELYSRLISNPIDTSTLVLDADNKKSNDNETTIREYFNYFNHLSDTEKMMAVDCVTYLPDDILVKIDRAAMAVSLETRVPLLDYRIVEFAWGLPQGLKIRDKESKWI